MPTQHYEERADKCPSIPETEEQIQDWMLQEMINFEGSEYGIIPYEVPQNPEIRKKVEKVRRILIDGGLRVADRAFIPCILEFDYFEARFLSSLELVR